MICAKSVLPLFTRYSKSTARSVHESMSAVQIIDTPNRVESFINRGVQPRDCSFNRTLVRFSRIAQYKPRSHEKAVRRFGHEVASKLRARAGGVPHSRAGKTDRDGSLVAR